MSGNDIRKTGACGSCCGDPKLPRIAPRCGCSSMVELRLPKPLTRVRFPSPAPFHPRGSPLHRRHLFESWQGWIDTIPSVAARGVRHHLRLVSAGVVEVR